MGAHSHVHALLTNSPYLSLLLLIHLLHSPLLSIQHCPGLPILSQWNKISQLLPLNAVQIHLHDVIHASVDIGGGDECSSLLDLLSQRPRLTQLIH